MVAEDSRHVIAIARFISQKDERVKLENFEYRYTRWFEVGRQTRRAIGRRQPACAGRGSGAGYFTARRSDGDKSEGESEAKGTAGSRNRRSSGLQFPAFRADIGNS